MALPLLSIASTNVATITEVPEHRVSSSGIAAFAAGRSGAGLLLLLALFVRGIECRDLVSIQQKLGR
jgi:hypothetical protein